MPIPASSRIRRKDHAGLRGRLRDIVAFTAVVIQFQLDGVDRGARLEAVNLPSCCLSFGSFAAVGALADSQT
jgi:hypothetical protein